MRTTVLQYCSLFCAHRKPCPYMAPSARSVEIPLDVRPRPCDVVRTPCPHYNDHGTIQFRKYVYRRRTRTLEGVPLSLPDSPPNAWLPGWLNSIAALYSPGIIVFMLFSSYICSPVILSLDSHSQA